MLFFYQRELFESIDGLEIVPMSEKDVVVEEIDGPRIKGYINIHLRSGRYYLVRTDGSYLLNENANKFAWHSGRRITNKSIIIYYLEAKKQYYKVYIETKDLRTIVTRMVAKTKFRLDGVAYNFKIDALKYADGRYLYRHHDSVYEFIDSDWRLLENGVASHTAADEQLPIEPELSKIFGFSIDEFSRTLPGEWYFDDSKRRKLEISHKFGGMMVPNTGHWLRESGNHKTWTRTGDLSRAHHGVFRGELIDVWRMIPMFDAAPSLLYSPVTEEYLFYNRVNIDSNCRFIDFTSSSDGREWSEYQTIEIDDFDYQVGSNYYTPSMFLARDGRTVISLNAFISQPKTRANTVVVEDRVLISQNRVDFDLVSSWRTTEYYPVKKDVLHKIRDLRLNIGGSLRYNERTQNWFAFEIGPYGKILKLTTRLDGFSSLRGTGSATTRPLRPTGPLELNFAADSLRVTLITADTETSVELTGDHPRYRLPDPSVGEFRLMFEMVNGAIYSLTGAAETLRPTPLFRQLRFCYRRMYDLFHGKYSYGAKKSGWFTATASGPIIRLLGRPVIEQMSAVIKQRVETESGEEVVTLVDTTIDPADSIGRVNGLPKLFFETGSPGIVYSVRLDDPLPP